MDETSLLTRSNPEEDDNVSRYQKVVCTDHIRGEDIFVGLDDGRKRPQGRWLVDGDDDDDSDNETLRVRTTLHEASSN